jgi:hypothetical protein
VVCTWLKSDVLVKIRDRLSIQDGTLCYRATPVDSYAESVKRMPCFYAERLCGYPVPGNVPWCDRGRVQRPWVGNVHPVVVMEGVGNIRPLTDSVP